jgi:hypothetical protein
MPKEDHDSHLRDVWRDLITKSHSYQVVVLYANWLGQLVT